MKTKANIHAGFFLLLFVSLHPYAQELRTFNQNASRTNHYSIVNSSGLNLTFSPVFSASLNKNNDSLLFRGNGGGFKMDGDYFFGKAGIGFSSGFGSSAADETSINKFLERNNIKPGEVSITKSNQQNIYLLLGPSVRFGSKVAMLLHAKGGLFINNSGLVMIQQKGAVRAAYMNGSTGKSIYPGFQTGFNIQYSTKSDAWSFGIGADYMGTKTQVNNYDARRNGGIDALKLSSTISDMVAGISVRYNIAATGRKHIAGVKYEDIKISRKSGSIIAADYNNRLNPTLNQMDFAIDEPGTHRTKAMDQSSCGPVTMRTTNPDGSISEMTFACPDDAAQYNQRLSTNVTTPKQTQGQSFGEKVQQGLQSSGVIHRDLAARNILFGKVSLVWGNVGGIETNESVSLSGGASTAAYAATGKISHANTGGINATFYVRETGSGMATGRRQYQPVYSDDAAGTCSECIASVVSNPLYNENENSGTNPMYEGKEKLSAIIDNDCDGVSGLTVLLTDVATGAVFAATKTESCGEFFFANLPSAPYAIKVSGTVISKKGYDISLKNKADFAGELQSDNNRWTIELNTGTGTAEQAAALIKTKTKSNQSNDKIINTDQGNNGIIWSPRSNLKVLPGAVGDLDGDGMPEIIVGNNNPGSSGLERGAPLKGVGVSLGKIPGGGGTNKTVQTNENGEFEFTNLEAGNYKIIMAQTFVLNDKTVLWVGSNEAADNIVTSESNLKGETVRKGWDGTVKGSTKIDDGQQQTRAQNNNTVRSNRTDNAILENANDNSENNNASKEQKTEKQKKWLPANFRQSALVTCTANMKELITSLAELDRLLNSDNSNPQIIVNTTRSNIKNTKDAIADAQQTLENLEQKDKSAALQELDQKMTAMNMQFTALQESLSTMGKQYTTISNVLKTKHDTVKNSISNIR